MGLYKHYMEQGLVAQAEEWLKAYNWLVLKATQDVKQSTKEAITK